MVRTLWLIMHPSLDYSGCISRLLRPDLSRLESMNRDERPYNIDNGEVAGRLESDKMGFGLYI